MEDKNIYNTKDLGLAAFLYAQRYNIGCDSAFEPGLLEFVINGDKDTIEEHVASYYSGGMVNAQHYWSSVRTVKNILHSSKDKFKFKTVKSKIKENT